MLVVHVVDQCVVAGAALTQEREDQLLLAVVVGLQEGQDVLVVVGDQRHPLGVAGRDAPDQRGGGAEAVPEDAVHGEHVGGVGAWCSCWLGHGSSCILHPVPPGRGIDT